MAFKNQGFEVILASSPKYEALTAEIFFDGKFVALVSQERGVDLMELEVPSINLDESKICRKVEMNGFIRTVETACKRLRGEIK